MNEKRRSEYSEKLRDPRWQKKRLEVMARDEFTCQSCFDSKSTLNVHHNYYKRNAAPWEYPLDALVTLCESCHEFETENRRNEEQSLLEVLRLIGFKAGHINGLMSALYHTFGDSPQFPDHWDWYLDKYILNFHSIAKEVADVIDERKKRREISSETEPATIKS
jgi:hypothetical protein